MSDNSEHKEKERKQRILKRVDEMMRSTHFPFSSENLAVILNHLSGIVKKNSSIFQDPKDEYSKFLHQLSEDIGNRKLERTPLFYRTGTILSIYEHPDEYAMYYGDALSKATAELLKDLMDTIWDSEGNTRSKDGRRAAIARHSQPGGSRDKQAKIREIWASGKYRSKSKCAEDEHEELGMSLDTAKKALRNTPTTINQAAARKG